MRHLIAGLLLTTGVAAIASRGWGRDAGLTAGMAGLLATAVEVASATMLRRALVPPFERLLKRWSVGLGLRFGAVAIVALAVLRWPDRFPIVPTAAGFLLVLIPLMLGEMWSVWTRMGTTQ